MGLSPFPGQPSQPVFFPVVISNFFFILRLPPAKVFLFSCVEPLEYYLIWCECEYLFRARFILQDDFFFLYTTLLSSNLRFIRI